MTTLTKFSPTRPELLQYFFRGRKPNTYRYIDGTSEGVERLYLPLEVDTEFTHPSANKNLLEGQTAPLELTITAQVRALREASGLIYAHPDIKEVARHPVFESGFVAIDYLNDLGFVNTKIERARDLRALRGLPIIQFNLFAFFAVADLSRLFTGEFHEDILALYRGRKLGKAVITQERRLRTTEQRGRVIHDAITLPWIVTLEGQRYGVELAVMDTGALHGQAGYASVAQSVGYDLRHKDAFSKLEKSRMLDMYLERPQDFDDYALGDLFNYDLLMFNHAKFSEVYKELGLEQWYSEPRLTIGSTVSKLFEASIGKLFGVDDPSEVIKTYGGRATADYLKRDTVRTAALLAKVDGGRARNNRPTDVSVEGAIADIDIAGAYATAQLQQLYPFGNPVTLAYRIDSTRNRYDSLRNFLKKYRHELVPGLWQARISLKPGKTLHYAQDFFASWFPPNDLSQLVTDTELEGVGQWWEVDNTGDSKYLTHEINNGLLNHDGLQWIENVASTRQRKELLDNLEVIAAQWYPASERVDSTEALLETCNNHKGINTARVSKRRGATAVTNIEQECHAWYAVPLGDLLISNLLERRSVYKAESKKRGTKHPLDLLYKLLANTTYGVMVSPFFRIGNTVVGNNITARVRALAWYMEKGLNTFQSITDGGAFDLNQVVYSYDREPNASALTQLYTEQNQRSLKDNRHLKLSPLGGFERIELEDNKQEGLSIIGHSGGARTLLGGLEWIDKAAMEHLRALYPSEIDVLSQFKFETKQVYDSGVFHGTANYLLEGRFGFNIAMRSYKSSQVPQRYALEGGKLTIQGDIQDSEPHRFLNALKNPRAVQRALPFVETAILKVKEYRKAQWNETPLEPGQTYRKVRLLRESSLSQFTFRTKNQFDRWLSETGRLKRKTGQGYEQFFLNEDSTLFYSEMVETLDKMVRSGAMTFASTDKSMNLHRKHSEHPHRQALEEVRELLHRLEHSKLEEEEEVLQD